MASLTRRRCAGEDGAELIEFAVVLPLLLLVVLGIIDFGLLFQRYLVVMNAAREGARVAVLPGYAEADVVARVEQYFEAGGISDAPPATVAPVTLGDDLCLSGFAVTAQYPHAFSFVSGIASLFGDGDFSSTMLTATSTMRNELAAAEACP